MSVKGQLAVLGGVFVIGGLGGAGLLYAVSSAAGPSEKNGLDETPAKGTQRAQREADPVSPARDAERAEATPKDPGVGLEVTDVIGTLEAEYQASLARTDRRAAPPLSESREAQRAEPTPFAVPAPELVAPAPTEPTVTAPAPTVPVEVAAAEPVQVVQGDVNTGNTNVTNVTNVTETTNQVSQIVVLGTPVYPGAYYPTPAYVGQPYAPPAYSGPPVYRQPRTHVAPSKPVQGSITARDRSPWGSTDYSTHYENPWGPTWGRTP